MKYADFLEFVRIDCQKERSRVNRRMFAVFLWCLLFPTASLFLLMALIRMGLLPPALRFYSDWVFLGFPMAYALYAFGTEVVVELPKLFRRGGMATTLDEALREAQWRERVMGELKRKIPASTDEWAAVLQSFQMDLDHFRNRIRYLAALAGAVFFLLSQLLDTLGTEGTGVSASGPGMYVLGRLEQMSTTLSQGLATVILLVLFYLSGMQTVTVLKRYLNCVELLSKGR